MSLSVIMNDGNILPELPGRHVGMTGPRLAPNKRARTWGTFYNRIGVVKRHFNQKVLTFPSLAVLVLVLLLIVAHATKARFENRAVEAWFH
jgi:hypothetical protein